MYGTQLFEKEMALRCLFFYQKEKTARSLDTVLVVLKSMRGSTTIILYPFFQKFAIKIIYKNVFFVFFHIFTEILKHRRKQIWKQEMVYTFNRTN